MKRALEQLVNGRVFELRSKSKRYPAPCALVTDEKGGGHGSPIFSAVDDKGVIGHGLYERKHNPGIYVPGIKRDEFAARAVRRRRDLERFDRDDLDLIRYGYKLDFNGRIRGSYTDMSLPVVVPSDWAVFWVPAFADGDFRRYHGPLFEFQDMLSGAWHYESIGGARRLGYKFGHVWATRHTGARLTAIREALRRRFDDLIEQPAKGSTLRRRQGRGNRGDLGYLPRAGDPIRPYKGPMSSEFSGAGCF